MKRAAAVAVAALACAALPAAASAHARLLGSTPADGEVFSAAPRDVVIRFDDPVSTGPGNAAVDAAGRSILGGRPRAHGRVLTIPLRSVGNGSYTVRWSIISDDGHLEAGIVAFAVGSGSVPHATLSPGGSGPPAADVIARLLLIAGALLAAGATVFLLAVQRLRRVVVLIAAGFVVAGVGAAIEWSRVPAGTRFTHAMIVAVAAATLGALVAAAAFRASAASALLAVPACVLLTTPAFGGHALDAGVPRFQVAVDLLHLAAASVWTGGLAALALVLPAAGAAARRFSRIALGAVATLAVTGVLRALSELTSFGQLFSTGYGRAIVVKTILFAALILLGYRARSRLLARARALRTSVVLELGLLAGLLLAVAFLTSLAPGRSLQAKAAATGATGPPPAPPQGAVTAAQALSGLAVAVAVQPDGSRLRVTVTVIAPSGDGANGLDVAVGGSAAVSCGSGCYRGETRPARVLRVSVGSGTVDFPLPPFPLRDGTAVLQQIGARYLRAHTVAFHERLSSGPGQVVTSDWQLQAPASLAFHASDGSSGVIIGRKRWDKQGTARWIESPQTPIVPQPQLPWTAAPEDVVELPAARLGGREVIRVAFVDPAIPAWFTVAADARTKAVVRVDMVAPAHFMLDTYRGLDVPMKIRPPR